MKKVLMVIAAVCLLSVFSTIAFAAEDGWLDNLEDALKQGAAETKLVMVDFTATWCGWCTKLKEEVFSTDEFKKAAENLVLASIDADQNRELVDRYKVEGFPTIVFLDTDGREVKRIVGFKALPEFLKELAALPPASPPKPIQDEKPKESKK